MIAVRRVQIFFVAAVIAALTLLGAPAAHAQTVANKIYTVYSCTYYGTGCRYAYSYMGYYDPRVTYWQYIRINSYDRWF